MADFEIRDLSFSYPEAGERRVLNHINLTVGRGEYVALCGRSGSGKTTLLRHLKTVLAPHGRKEGEIFFDGRPLSEISMREQSARIGYVMQDPDSQIVTDKVWHELAFGLESLGMEQNAMRLRVAEMASYFGIQRWFHRNVNELSGGQKQLLNLASVMAMQPDVLILDEPVSQLDPIAASDFLNTVRKINRDLRTAVIITEHRLEEIFSVADKVVVMDKGEILAEDHPQRVGEILRDRNDEMFVAMPTPVRVYYGVKSSLPCPLTVREGSQWLDRIFEKKPPEIKRLDKSSRSPWKKELSEIPAEDCAVIIKEIWFRYEKNSPDILKGMSLKVPKKSIFALMGGNGVGKTTALKAVCGICRPYRGKIYIEGRPLSKYKDKELFDGVLAMLPQDPRSLFVKKTVREELEEMVDVKTEETARVLAETAEICEIEELLDSHPYDLSGGEEQRVALAKVLLRDPEILLLDEPTKGMDNFFKIKFAGVLSRLRERGVTVIMVSHDVEFCAGYADFTGMLFDGEMIAADTPDRFFSGNSFYTTAADRMSRHIFENAVTEEALINLCRINLSGGTRLNFAGEEEKE